MQEADRHRLAAPVDAARGAAAARRHAPVEPRARTRLIGAVAARADPRRRALEEREVRRPSAAISGTNWIAEAPVPITATRWPARSWSWSHRAEWNIVPAKRVEPGDVGDGRLAERAAVASIRRPGADVLAARWCRAASAGAPRPSAAPVDGVAEAQVRSRGRTGRRTRAGSPGSRAGRENVRTSPGSARRRTSTGATARRRRSPGRCCRARCRRRRPPARRRRSRGCRALEPDRRAEAAEAGADDGDVALRS